MPKKASINTGEQHEAGRNLGKLVTYLKSIEEKNITRFKGDSSSSMVEPVSGITILF